MLIFAVLTGLVLGAVVGTLIGPLWFFVFAVGAPVALNLYVRNRARRQRNEFAEQLPSLQSTMHLYPVDGAVQRVESDATAFSYRDANWSQVIVGVDHDPASATRLRDWTVAYWEALHLFNERGGYVNFLMDEGQDRVRATYRGNYDRLARVKAEYDPGNLFYVNQNIRPAA